jgi:hypothetical protein
MIASPFTHLIVGPDYGAFPVWDRSHRHLGGMVRAKSLGISDGLVQALDAWALDWEDESPESMDAADWESRGRELTAELQRELGPDVVVAFYMDGIDVPPFDRAGFIEDHRVEPGEIGRAPGFDLR